MNLNYLLRLIPSLAIFTTLLTTIALGATPSEPTATAPAKSLPKVEAKAEMTSITQEQEITDFIAEAGDDYGKISWEAYSYLETGDLSPAERLYEAALSRVTTERFQQPIQAQLGPLLLNSIDVAKQNRGVRFLVAAARAKERGVFAFLETILSLPRKELNRLLNEPSKSGADCLLADRILARRQQELKRPPSWTLGS